MRISAGWYPDPNHPKQLRWWDGEGWTDRTSERPRRRGHRLALALGALAAVALALGVAIDDHPTEPAAPSGQANVAPPSTALCAAADQSPQQIVSRVQAAAIGIHQLDGLVPGASTIDAVVQQLGAPSICSDDLDPESHPGARTCLIWPEQGTVRRVQGGTSYSFIELCFGTKDRLLSAEREGRPLGL